MAITPIRYRYLDLHSAAPFYFQLFPDLKNFCQLFNGCSLFKIQSLKSTYTDIVLFCGITIHTIPKEFRLTTNHATDIYCK